MNPNKAANASIPNDATRVHVTIGDCGPHLLRVVICSDADVWQLGLKAAVSIPPRHLSPGILPLPPAPLSSSMCASLPIV